MFFWQFNQFCPFRQVNLITYQLLHLGKIPYLWVLNVKMQGVGVFCRWLYGNLFNILFHLIPLTAQRWAVMVVNSWSVSKAYLDPSGLWLGRNGICSLIIWRLNLWSLITEFSTRVVFHIAKPLESHSYPLEGLTQFCGDVQYIDCLDLPPSSYTAPYCFSLFKVLL